MQNPNLSGTPAGEPANSLLPTVTGGAGARPADDRPGSSAVDAASSGQSLVGQVKQKLAGTLDKQKGAAADMVAELAQVVQRSGEHFEGRQDWIASAIARGAEELNTFANSIREKDLGELAGQVQSFARQRPALFMGAALAAGFAVARIGKVVAGDVSREDLPSIPEVGNGQH